MLPQNPKVKVYKNPKRSAQAETIKPYIPQYKLMGIEPNDYHSQPQGHAVKPQIVKPQPLPLDNPRAPRPMIRQPYAEAASPIGRGRGILPNVGNNVEQTWSSLDGEIIDDLTETSDQEMIDNNEFATDQALGYQAPQIIEVEDGEYTTLEGLHSEGSGSDDLSSVLSSLDEESFLLMVEGEAICSGPMEEIQEQAKALVFGEHSLCDGNPKSIEDIVIVKRVKIKVGLFLE